MATEAGPTIRWWTIPVAVGAALVTVAVGATQTIPGGTLDSTGADILMVASLLVMLTALTVFFTGFLQADEHGTVSAPHAVWWSTPVAIVAMSLVFVIGAMQAIPSSPPAIDSQGADILMIAAILVFLIAVSVRFTSFLQAEERGEAETAAHAAVHTSERVPHGVVAHVES